MKIWTNEKYSIHFKKTHGNPTSKLDVMTMMSCYVAHLSLVLWSD